MSYRAAWASSRASAGSSRRTISPRMRTIGGMPAEMWRSEAPSSLAKPSRAVRSKAMGVSGQDAGGVGVVDPALGAQDGDQVLEALEAVHGGQPAQHVGALARGDRRLHRLGHE